MTFSHLQIFVDTWTDDCFSEIISVKIQKKQQRIMCFKVKISKYKAAS